MRKKLKQFDWHIHSPDDHDIDYVYHLVKAMIQTRKESLDEFRKRIEKENPDFAMDIMDDIGYYHGLDNLILWQMALWRMQGIFEGMIILKYLGDFTLADNLIGLKAKLEAMIKDKYSIVQSDYEELIDWGKMRNALSHCPPPERYGYVDLKDVDILEYMSLTERVIKRWNIELDARKPSP